MKLRKRVVSIGQRVPLVLALGAGVVGCSAGDDIPADGGIEDASVPDAQDGSVRDAGRSPAPDAGDAGAHDAGSAAEDADVPPGDAADAEEVRDARIDGASTDASLDAAPFPDASPTDAASPDASVDAAPADAASPDAASPDASADADTAIADAGADARDAASVCIPGAATCNGDTLSVCASNGSSTTTTCPLGCSNGACLRLTPTNLPANTCDTPGTATFVPDKNSPILDTGSGCDSVVVQGGGAPEICVRKFATVAGFGTNTIVRGPRALAIVATETLNLVGGLTASAEYETPGAGGGDARGAGAQFSGQGAGRVTSGAAGGGMYGDAPRTGGGSAYGTLDGAPLLAGANGGSGGIAMGGAGGGAVQLVACGTLVFGNNADFVRATGGAGRGGRAPSNDFGGGGGGGGSGGTVLIEAARFVLTQTSYELFAFGGGGGGGGNETQDDTDGFECMGGGSLAMRTEGKGGDCGNPPASGINGAYLPHPAPGRDFYTGGGGGGGADGVIRINTRAGIPFDLSKVTSSPPPTFGVLKTH